jgi:YhcH/YjgK/YiaL family protein
MIIDALSNAPLYYAIHPGFKTAFDYLRKTDLAALPVGRYEIEGEKLYAMVQEYSTKPKEEAFWEAHRRYIDLQYVIQGAEIIGYAHVSRLRQAAYDPNKDYLPLHGEGDYMSLPQGHFIVLMPQDAHMPGIALDSPGPVKKIVIKIAVAA